MTVTPDHRVQDFGQSLLTLRTDLNITPRMDGDKPGYLVEDKARSQFFRIGVPECTFISLLDGKTTVAEALAVTASVDREDAFTEEQAAGICRWLIENQLATTKASEAAAPVSEEQKPGWSKWNPWFLRIPLVHPDRWVTRVTPWLDWIYTPWVTILSVALHLVALQQVCHHWTRFTSSVRGVLSPDRWLWLLVSWVVIKMIHELGHAVACKRYGGNVRESGVILILGMPLAYVDVTSSWRFRSKWRRIHTAAAGIQMELIFASIAALIWIQVRPGMLSDLCCQVALMASVATLLVNANPLMRFDGYYILSDLFELPNLHSQGQQTLMHFMRKYFLGVESSLPAMPIIRRVLIGVYGALALIWRVVVCFGLAYASSKLLHGAGLVIAVIGLAMWLCPPIVSSVKYLIFGSAFQQPNRLRFAATTLGLLTALTLAATLLPWPLGRQAPCIVDYSASSIVRAKGSGFLTKMISKAGQSVQEGDVLALMENEALAIEVKDLELQVGLSTKRIRDLLHERHLSAYQAEQKNLQTLEKRLAERQEELAGLTVRAPSSGRVVGRDLDSFVGQFIEKGAELMVIGDEDAKELRLSIAQQDLDSFSDSVEQEVHVRIRGHAHFDATLARVEPRGSLLPTNLAICAPHGGVLPVRPVSQSDGASEEVRYELLAPRFEGVIELDPRLSRSLIAGQRGVSAIHSKLTIAGQILALIRRQGR